MDMNPPENLVGGKEKPSLKKWDYETFKEYLLSQARGEKFLLPIDEFPEEIELSEYWHKVLNIMRGRTGKDQIERVALVGYSLSQRVIYLPTAEVTEIPWQWERNAPVSTLAIELQMGFAKQQGAGGFVGLLHSHPPNDIGVFKFKLKTGRLSAGDLHIALTQFFGPMIGVADGAMNSLAFKTKGSIIPREHKDEFYDLWEGKPQPRNLDVVIAQKYKVALYKGNVNQTLKRVV